MDASRPPAREPLRRITLLVRAKAPADLAAMALGIVFILSACSASGADESARNGAGTPSASEAPIDNDAPTSGDTPSSGGESPRADDAPSSDSPTGDDAPESETPDAAPGGDAQGDLQSSEQDRITICHRTNGSNEWVEITISESALALVTIGAGAVRVSRRRDAADSAPHRADTSLSPGSTVCSSRLSINPSTGDVRPG